MTHPRSVPGKDTSYSPDQPLTLLRETSRCLFWCLLSGNSVGLCCVYLCANDKGGAGRSRGGSAGLPDDIASMSL